LAKWRRRATARKHSSWFNVMFITTHYQEREH
jgi:hypothetical protein